MPFSSSRWKWTLSAAAAVSVWGVVAFAEPVEVVAEDAGATEVSADASVARVPAPIVGAEAQVVAQPTYEELEAAEADAEVIEIVQRAPPGSATTVGTPELERFEKDDILKVLLTVPGVYVRQEDGYGLRPNIGMRGVSSERSAKVTLMEDGALVAPAPYSSPAAYYFPMVTRLAKIEVLKGPSSLIYGPATVGGAVAVESAPIAMGRHVYLDVAGGSDLYGKAHARLGQRGPRFGVQLEAVHLRTDGFKQLDGGGGTGFAKNDLLGKLRWNSAPGAEAYHVLELKVGWADEDSDESYTGLTRADFDANPYRRYRGTHLDHMAWTHLTVQANHKVSWGSDVSLSTVAYRHAFDRTWRRLDKFGEGSGRVNVNDVLADPMGGANQVYYDALVGNDSDAVLSLAVNQREFVSQGVESRGLWRAGLHTVELGARVHHDQADRVHLAESYRMQGGSLRLGNVSTDTDEVLSSLALATFARHRLTFDRLELTYGVRGELVFTGNDQRKLEDNPGDRDFTYGAVIPGAGATYRLIPELTLLAGVYRGFLPVTPPAVGDEDPSPEDSVNAEAGARWQSQELAAELVGFYSHYENLKGYCSASTGCTSEMADEFEGGTARILGSEASATWEPRWLGYTWPVSAAYTFTHAEFTTTFDSDFPLWGDVVEGDELPYTPQHQLSARVGLRGQRFETTVGGRYVSSMRDVAGQGEVDAEESVDDSLVIDLAASIDFASWGKLYATCDNLLDEHHVVSRRPFGLRPGSPRLFVLGYKQQF